MTIAPDKRLVDGLRGPPGGNDLALPGEPVPHRIEIRLRDINQLFNTMDPSPFHEKDLDADAEEFIVSWAEEFPAQDPLLLIIHLPERHRHARHPLVEQAIRHYFEYRSHLCRRELRRLLRNARTSLLIGGVFLCVCLISGKLLAGLGTGTWHGIISEGLTIAGWVAMWRPLQMYLYDWWPVRRRLRVFEKMSKVGVEVVADKREIIIPSHDRRLHAAAGT